MRGRRLGAWVLLVLLLAALVPPPEAEAVNVRLVIGMSGEMAPLQYLDGEGEPAGVHRELLDAFVENSEDSIRCVLLPDDAACRRALLAGEVDVVLTSSLRGEPELAAWTTEPLLTVALCAISDARRAGEEDYSGKVAVFEYGTVKYAYLDKLDIGSYLAVGSQEQVLQAVESGRADLAVGPQDCLLYLLETGGRADDYTIVRSYLGELSYALTVRPGDTVTLRYLGSRLVRLRTSGRYDEIYNRWAALWTQDDGAVQARMVRGLLAALGAAVLVVLVFAGFSSVLKRQLRRMTQALHDTNDQLARQLDKARRESATQQRIIDSAAQSILLFEPEGRITMLNRTAARIAGGDAIGCSILDIPPFSQITRPFLGAGDRAEPLPQNQVFRVQREGEAPALLKCTLVPLPGEGDGLMLSAEDITEEEGRKQQIFEAEKITAINRLVAGVAHEIRNPLMTIRTFASMIQEERGDEEFQAAFHEIVPKEVDRINDLVNRFINYAKPSSAQPAVADAAALVRECLYLTDPVARQSPIRFDTRLEAGLLIRVSEGQLKQVLINVIINGIEAMERRLKQEDSARRLTMAIRAQGQGERAVISVRDEGVGMTPEELERCRTPYFTTKPEGIGLGLCVSNDLVRLNGGTMTIESEPGAYTLIQIAFAREEVQ